MNAGFPFTVGLVLIAPLLFVGCAASEPRPDRGLDIARAAILEAETAGARDIAPILLDRARSKLDRARALITREEYAPARRALEQATADARLAKARANTAQIRDTVDELNETIEMLRQRVLGDPS